ncbi:unnamed protein product, partial [Rotaria sp. Silwood2]
MLKPLAKDDDNRSSARELMVKLNESLDKPICRRTIINYLQKCGYEYKIKIEKPFLNKENRKARLQWCLEHSNWTVDEWKKVLFSDESTFYVIKRKSETKIWRTKDEQWKEGCMAVAATGGGGRVGFWSVITWQGTGCFRVYSENTNSDVYCDIWITIWFQHYSYMAWKTTLCSNTIVLKWPAKSPDLNPIEHLWSIIDNKLKSRRMCSVKDLTDGLSAEWLSITQELCEQLVFSMPQRIQKCIA